MASSQGRGPLTPGGRRSRRSWFDTPPLTSLDPKPTQPQDENSRPKKSNKRRSIDTVETLTLTHFTSAPRLGFGNAVVGTRKFRTLIIRNPHDYEQEVIIEKFPFKKKFYVDHTRFEVGPGDVFSLEITWTPEEAVGVREMVQFFINGVYRLQCFLFGVAENPKPIRKTRRRKFGPPISENNDVIQTPALTRIKSNYNPRRSQEIRDLQALVENKEFHHNHNHAIQKEADGHFGSPGNVEKKKLQDLSSVSPNTLLDQSLSFIAHDSTPVKGQRGNRFVSDDHSDMDATAMNNSLISAGQVLVSPNSFMKDMLMTKQDGNKAVDKNNIPSPSALFNNSIPHNLMMQHLDTINLSLMSELNSPLVKPSLKAKAGTKRRSLTRAYRVAENKKTYQAKNGTSPTKAVGRAGKRRSGNLSKKNGVKAGEHLLLNPGLVDSPRRGTFIVKKSFSPKVMKGKSRQKHLFPEFTSTPQNAAAAIVSSRQSLTVTKSRPSDALPVGLNDSRTKLFDTHPTVHFEEETYVCAVGNKENSLYESNVDGFMESGQECEKLKSTQSHEPSPNQFCSPTTRNLPKSPNPDNSRRSTHVVKTPKVLHLDSTQQKRLNFDGLVSDDGGDEGSISSSGGNNELYCNGESYTKTPSLESEVKSRQATPITSVCVMSPQLVDYEILSNEGNSSGQSVSSDSLDVTQCSNGKSQRGTPSTSNTVIISSSVGVECENRVDVLSDTHREEGIPFTSLKTPRKDLDWSFCERGDTKILPPNDHVPSTTFAIETDMSKVEIPMTTSKSQVHSMPSESSVVVASQLASTFSISTEAVSVSQQETGQQKNVQRSVSAGRIIPSRLCRAATSHSQLTFAREDLSKNAVKDGGNGKSKARGGCNNVSDRPGEFNKIKNVRHDQMKSAPPAPKKMKNTEINLPATKTKTVVTKSNKTTKVSVKGVAKSKLILVKKAKNAVPRHPMPYAARNMYYDERWMEKQENGFAQWINFVLTPPDEYVTVTSKPKVDAVALTLGNQQPQQTRLAPTKEVLSIRAYAARRRLNRLRRSACQLYQSDEVANIIRKIEVEVESQRIAARKDRMLHADLGIKQSVLDLLLQFSPLWLRVGLETVFGEVLPLHSNTDVVGLSRYVVTRLLACPDIAAQYSHPSVPHLYTDGYAAAVSRHTVKKFLLLIYFMDRAKTQRLLEYDPCLFCKDADIKSSKEILIQFSREVLSGEGDLTRHLAYLGYTVCQVQKPFDEFDYAVSNISSDLKDGLRLSRLLELLGGDNCIMGKLRTPAISRLQKIHNMEVFFSAMTKRGLQLKDMSGTTARDVVDGHREKTLAMMWHLILHFQAVLNVDEEKLKDEINLLRKSLQLRIAMQKIGADFTEDWIGRRDSGETTTFVNNERMQLIFRWCRLVCLHYGVKIENMTVSFSDGRAFCCLLHHYHPVLLPLSDIRFQTTQQFQEAAENVCDGDDPDLSVDWGKRGGLCPNENDPAHFEKLLANEKANFKVLYEKVSALGGVPLMIRHTHMSNTIPDEKVVSTYVSYLCVRLLDIREEVKAARVLQMAWRRRKLRQTFKQRLWAAQIIQKTYRKYLVSKRIKEEQMMVEERTKMASAVTKLQAAYRGYRERKRLNYSRAAIVVQTFWRMKKAQKMVVEMRLEKERKDWLEKADRAALTIQKYYRGFQVREDLKHVRKCTVILQSLWRMRKAQRVVAEIKFENQRKAMEEKLKQENNAAEIIQKCYRGFAVRRAMRHMAKCAVVLQSLWRMKKAKRVVTEMRCLKKERERFAAVNIQKHYRGFKVRKEVKKLTCCVIVLQSLWRMKKAKQVVTEMRCLKKERERFAAVNIQKHYRGFKVRKEVKKLTCCVIVLQSLWRMKKAKQVVTEMRCLKKERERFAAVNIQKHYRGFKVRKEVKKLTCCVIVLQSLWRMKKAKQVVTEMRCLKKERERFAAVNIQKHYRGFKVRKEVKKLTCCVIVLQSLWRMKKAMQVVTEMRCLKKERERFAAVNIQKHYRGFKVRKEVKKLTCCVIVLQSLWRMKKAKQVVTEMRCLKKEKERFAAVNIQKHYRGFKVRKEVKKLTCCVIVLQSLWRMKKAKQVVTEMRCLKKERERFAAMNIQKHYRGFKVRKEVKKLTCCVIVLQSLWRMKKAKQVVTEMRCLKKERERFAAVNIQKHYRGFKVRKEVKKLTCCVIVLQSLWRMKKAKQVVTEMRCLKKERERFAAVNIQKHYRGFKVRKEVKKLTCCVIVLQSLWRMKKAKQVVTEMRCLKKERERFAAVNIQKHYRGFKVRKEVKKLTCCVIVLQSLWRMKKAKQVVTEMRCLKKERERFAAVNIQKHYRGFKVRKEVKQLTCCVIVLQSLWRMKKAKQIVTEMKLEKERKVRESLAAVKIQKCYRGFHTRKELQRMSKCVIVLQSLWRMKKAKQIVSEMKLEKERKVRESLAAVKIQKCYRGFHTRKELQRMSKCVIVLQSLWRMKKVKQIVSEMKLEKERKVRESLAAVNIQKCYRGFKTRKELQHMSKCVIVIQSLWRMKKAKEDLKHVQKCTVVLQSLWRMRKAQRVVAEIKFENQRKAMEERLRQENNAAVIIQKCYRGFAVRRAMRHMAKCAVVLQSLWRMKKAKQVVTEMRCLKKERECFAAVNIQKHYRGFKVRKEVKKLTCCIIVLQSLWRVKKAKQFVTEMKLEKERKVRESLAAVRIQKCYRGFKTRKELQCMSKCVIVLQSLWRMKKTKQIVSEMKLEKERMVRESLAAVNIQKCYRGFRTRKELQRMSKCVIVIQSLWRMKKAKEDLKHVRKCTVMLQSLWRMRKAQRVVAEIKFDNQRKAMEERLRQENNAAEIIQKCYRGFAVRRAMRHMAKCAVVLQSLWRMKKAKQVVAEMRCMKKERERFAAVNIQKHYRGFKVRKEVKKLTCCVIVLQSLWRMKRAKQIVSEMKLEEEKKVRESLAALRIQKCYRGFRTRKDLQRMSKCVIVIQSLWRMKKAQRVVVEISFENQRKAMEERLRQENNAADIIQKCYRGFAVRRAMRHMAKCAVVLQSLWRMKKAKQVVTEMELEEERKVRESLAAVRIQKCTVILQSLWRKRKAQRVVAEIKSENQRRMAMEERLRQENNAAEIIQKCYRGFKTRKELQCMSKCVIVLQSLWRMKKAKQIVSEMNLEKERMVRESLAALRIQKCYRGFRTRKEVEDERENEKEEEEEYDERENEKEEEEEYDERENEKEEEEEYDEREKGKEEEEEYDERENEKEEEEEYDERENEKEEEEEYDERENEKEEEEEYDDREKEKEEEEEYDERENEKEEEEEYDERENEKEEEVEDDERENEKEGEEEECVMERVQEECGMQQEEDGGGRDSSFGVEMCLEDKQDEASRMIQRNVRAFLKYRPAREARRQTSAVRIQALWRGHVVRRDLKCKRLKAARKRLHEAIKSGNTNTLGSRTAAALAYLLADNDMACVLSALMNLEVSTRLSLECCERLVEAGAVAILVKLLSSCNRSVPHMEIIKYTTDILLNLAHYDKTVDSLLDVPNMTPVILNMMQIFREKGSIFYKLCALLGTLARDSHRRRMLLACPRIVDQVRSIHALALRKHRSNDKRPQKTPAKSAKTNSKQLDDPLTAISFVMSSLQLNPK